MAEDNKPAITALAAAQEFLEEIIRDFNMSPELEKRFWVAMHVRCGDMAGISAKGKEPTNELLPMSDAAAKGFECRRMPWGKHTGEQIKDVPLSYLEKLCDHDPFVDDLKRYLESPRIRVQRKAFD